MPSLPVGPLLPPPGTYSFAAVTPPIAAPDGDRLAQLAHIPYSLSDFVGAAFPPFGQPRRIPSNLPPPDERIAYSIVGLVQYRGDEGEIVMETIVPSPAALRRELVLGNPAGALLDGTPLATVWSNHLRWRRDDVIIDMYAESRGISQLRLKTLAERVVLL